MSIFIVFPSHFLFFSSHCPTFSALDPCFFHMESSKKSEILYRTGLLYPDFIYIFILLCFIWFVLLFFFFFHHDCKRE